MESIDYFESYEDLEIHKLMLEDRQRNGAYKRAIFNNRDDIKDKVVLDVGAGTGILSIFCAQAGAKKVYAVEASNIYLIAEETVKENGYEDVIKVIHGKIEDVDLPEQVDILISEWMGFYLLHEAMLDSVVFARDKFLKPDGMIFPESATIYSSPCSIPSMNDYWESVEGISMTYFGAKLRENASKKPLTEIVPANKLLTDPEVIVWLDLREVTCEDLKEIAMRHVAVANKSGRYQGICLWFSCTFPGKTTEPIVLTTEPEEPPTHWKQTIITLPSDATVEEGAPITYDLLLKKAPDNNRHYIIEVTMLDPNDVEHPEYCLCHMTKCILVREMFKKYELQDVEMGQGDKN